MSNSFSYFFLVLVWWSEFYMVFGTDNRDYANYEFKLRQVLQGNKKPIDLQHRPSLYSNQSTHMEVGLSVIDVIEFNAETNILTTNIWLRLNWYDYSYHWNEEEYGGINVLRFPIDYIWTPDVLLENCPEASQSEMGHYKSNFLAYPNGQILWVPSSTQTVSCAVNLHKFPFDSHVCTFVFRSWSIDGKTLKLVEYSGAKHVDFSDYFENNEWEVSDAADKVDYKEVDRDVTVIFAITLKRRAYYYILTFIIPVLLSWVFMLVVFWLPLSNQRIFLASLTVVYLEILLLQLRWSIPNNGSVVPLIVVMCGQSIIFASLLLVFSVALEAMAKTAYPPRLPMKLKTVLHRWLSCVLCVEQNRIPEATAGAQLLNNSSVELNIDKVDQNEICCDWVLLITVLNRLVFIVYFFSFVTIFLITVLIN